MCNITMPSQIIKLVKWNCVLVTCLSQEGSICLSLIFFVIRETFTLTKTDADNCVEVFILDRDR